MSTCRRMWTDRQIRSMADESAKIRIEAGLTENAKPLYWHSITLKRISGGALTYYFDIVIVDNNEDPFTLATFNEWLADHQDAEVKIVQGYISTYATNLVSSLKYNAENEAKVSTIKLDTGAVQSTNTFTDYVHGAEISDAVDKVN